MIVIGLTGGIAMGKSTIAMQFKQCGAAVCDSDALVHKLLAKGGEAVEKVRILFPSAYENGAINRKILGKEVFSNNEKLKQLEAILHPLVRKYQGKFIRKARQAGKEFVVLDIPLLFETQGEVRCDYTVVASAPAFLQRRRAFARSNMTEEKFRHILSYQLKNHEKIKRADFVVFSGLGKYNSLRHVKQIIQLIKRKR